MIDKNGFGPDNRLAPLMVKYETMLNQEQIDQFFEQGYLIANPLDSGLLQRLREASRVEVETARAVNPNDLSYTIALQPSPFADYLASPYVLDVVQDLLGSEIHDLSLHCRGGNFKYAHKMVWHRDGMDRHHTVEEEMRILTRRLKTIQWNCALYDGDACFHFVPGSHRRPISAQELASFKANPRADLPGQMVAELKAGETIYYNNSALHQGVYQTGQRRETLSGGFKALSVPGSQHYACDKEYMLEPGYLETMPVRLRPCLEASIQLIRDIKAGRVRKGDALGSAAYMEMVQSLDADGRC